GGGAVPARRIRASRRLPGADEPVGHTPRPALLSGPVRLRSGTLDAGGRRRAPPVRLLPVRRRLSPLYRRGLRLDGGRPGARGPRLLMAVPSPAGPRRPAAADHPAAEARHSGHAIPPP